MNSTKETNKEKMKASHVPGAASSGSSGFSGAKLPVGHASESESPHGFEIIHLIRILFFRQSLDVELGIAMDMETTCFDLKHRNKVVLTVIEIYLREL